MKSHVTPPNARKTLLENNMSQKAKCPAHINKAERCLDQYRDCHQNSLPGRGMVPLTEHRREGECAGAHCAITRSSTKGNNNEKSKITE
jgi:hypothetical protein